MTFTEYKRLRCHRDCKFRVKEPVPKTLDEACAYVQTQGERLLSVDYVNTKSAIQVECGQCKTPYTCTMANYRNKRRHRECSTANRAENSKLPISEVRKYITGMGDELLSTSFDGCNKNIDVKCGVCLSINTLTFGNYKQFGKQCKTCANNKLREERAFTIDFVRAYVKEQGDVLQSNEYVNALEYIDFACGACTRPFRTTFAHYKHHGSRCLCNSQSIGEKAVEDYLKHKQIRYIRQKKYDDCKNAQKLPFDFYLPDLDILIEFDGIQHFKPIEYFGGETTFLLQQYNDKIKTQYCIDNMICLVRICYTEIKKVNDILDNYLNDADAKNVTVFPRPKYTYLEHLID